MMRLALSFGLTVAAVALQVVEPAPDEVREASRAGNPTAPMGQKYPLRRHFQKVYAPILWSGI